MVFPCFCFISEELFTILYSSIFINLFISTTDQMIFICFSQFQKSRRGICHDAACLLPFLRGVVGNVLRLTQSPALSLITLLWDGLYRSVRKPRPTNYRAPYRQHTHTNTSWKGPQTFPALIKAGDFNECRSFAETLCAINSWGK